MRMSPSFQPENAMKANTTSHQRAKPEGERLARKRYSCRLPIDVAARLEALCELHPDKARSQLLSDLLRIGLEQTQRQWHAKVPSAPAWPPDVHRFVYLMTGPFAEFRGLSYKHHLALEKERSGDAVQPLPPESEYLLDDPG